MISRAAGIVLLLAATGLYTGRARSAEAVVPREPLRSLPLRLGAWDGRDALPFADDVVAKLGVDDYINRQYVSASGGPIGLYVGYYASQRQGDTIHSPQNCLPGAGWQPVAFDRVTIPTGTTPIRVNRYVIQKALDRQVVLYWYQGRGRVVASEYANKMLLMLDAARLHRTAGGLVRLMAPVTTSPEDASRELASFAATLFPRLGAYLP